jgi:hypothetical protein
MRRWPNDPRYGKGNRYHLVFDAAPQKEAGLRRMKISREGALPKSQRPTTSGYRSKLRPAAMATRSIFFAMSPQEGDEEGFNSGNRTIRVLPAVFLPDIGSGTNQGGRSVRGEETELAISLAGSSASSPCLRALPLSAT